MAQAVVEQSPTVFEDIRREIDRLDVESSLRLSIKDHYDNLRSLATNLQKLGLDEIVVDQQVLSLFDHYRENLLRHVSTLPARAPNATDDEHD